MSDQTPEVQTERNEEDVTEQESREAAEQALAEKDAPGTLTTISMDEISDRYNKIQQVGEHHMQEGLHYGPPYQGADKNVLLKPGAEMLGTLFQLAPDYDVKIRRLGDGHRDYGVKCKLYHIPTGNFVGAGEGSCSTMESKYRYRNKELECPNCGEETIIKGKEEYGGGYVCWKKKGGCGAKYDDDDPRITNQSQGKKENPDIADVYNTVLKMAKKRAHIDAILTATGASDMYTQDVDEFDDYKGSTGQQTKQTKRSSRKSATTQQKPADTSDLNEISELAAQLPEERQEGVVKAIEDGDIQTKQQANQMIKSIRRYIQADTILSTIVGELDGEIPEDFDERLESAEHLSEIDELIEDMTAYADEHDIPLS